MKIMNDDDLNFFNDFLKDTCNDILLLSCMLYKVSKT